MVLGQRGRQPPQGKVESNPSITDLSFTAQAETNGEASVWIVCCYTE